MNSRVINPYANLLFTEIWRWRPPLTFDMTLINKKPQKHRFNPLAVLKCLLRFKELSKSLQPTPSRTKDAESQQIFRSPQPHRLAATKTTVDYIRSPVWCIVKRNCRSAVLFHHQFPKKWPLIAISKAWLRWFFRRHPMHLCYLNALQTLNIQNQDLLLKAATPSFHSKPAINCHFFKKRLKLCLERPIYSLRAAESCRFGWHPMRIYRWPVTLSCEVWGCL